MKIFLIQLLLLLFITKTYAQLNVPCGTTCSPSACLNVTNSACTAINGTTSQQMASSIANIGCSTSYYPVNHTWCTNATLASLFAKGIASGSILAAYCTDKYLIILSNGMPNHNDSLAYVPHPPGGGGTGGYASQCVTRGHVQQFFRFKIPLYPTLLSTDSTTNNVNSFPTGVMLSGVALPNEGNSGVTVTGLPMYPPYNDQSGFTWLSCEMDGCNAHAGKGFDYHYHGDPFHATAGKCMYSTSDYTGGNTGHPPIIGFSRDGYLIYGRHLNSNNEGYSVALDNCGGHSHGTYGYHYHSQLLNQTFSATAYGYTAGNSYIAYLNGPYKCWRGDISSFTTFWDDRSDLQPSCVMTNYYFASGYGISLNPSATIVTTTTTTAKSKSSILTSNYIALILQSFMLFILFKNIF